jgi:acetyl-CoA carboxylase carboxyl transferase subunit alpha
MAQDPPPSRSQSEPRLAFETPIYEMEARLSELEAHYAKNRTAADSPRIAEQIRRLRRELVALKREIYAHLEPWQIVQVSRHQQRPQTRDYIDLIFEQFLELHGDRALGDDKAIVTGLAHLDDQKVMFIGHQKGKNLAERKNCNFGCAHPEGYRKALLKMRLAEKFGLPIISFIDTPGAYPGITAEERGQALVIAENLMAMSQIRTPIVGVVIGEGGSGGALGIGIGDRLAMLEFTYYSVISPEGCATILWKGAEHAPKAAAALKLTSRDLLRFGIIDEIITEPPGGAHRDHREAAASLKTFLIHSIRQLREIPTDELVNRRYDKYRKIGVYLETTTTTPDPERNGLADTSEPAPPLSEPVSDEAGDGNEHDG